MTVKSSKYDLLVPEGGWGYVITLAVSVMFIVTVVPLAAFGLVYGDFLAGLGDKTSGIAIAGGVFNTILSFTGLPANQLLQKYSCRKVGLIGAGFFFIGTFGSIFVTSLMQLIISFGVFEGIGFGLMMPAVFTSFNSYFDKRKNMMMSIAQVIVIAVSISWTAISEFLLETYQFRGTIAIFSAWSLNAFVAMGVLQPVEWHMRNKISDVEMKKLSKNSKTKENSNVGTKEEVCESDAMLSDNLTNEVVVSNEPRKSIVSISSFSYTVPNNVKGIIDTDLTVWQKISNSLDLPLFKDPVYVNIAIGISLSMTSDLQFLSLLPPFLLNAGFNSYELTLMMTIYFTADLVSRILLSIATAIFHVRNRYVFLGGTLLSAVFRTAFVLDNTFEYIACVVAALGFLRCFINTPMPLVIAEAYPTRFATAFSLYMVVCGIVSLVFGLLIAFVKEQSGSDEAVIHVLTIAFLGCGLPWVVELMSERMNRKK